MIFKVNGTNIVPLAATGGISWKRVNIDLKSDMIMQDGTQFVDRLGARYEWTFRFRPMTAAELADLTTLLDQRGVTVQFTDPQTNETATADYYVSDIPAGWLVKRTAGAEYWGGITATFSSKPSLAVS